MFIRYQIQSVSRITNKPRGIFCGLWHLQSSAVMTDEDLLASRELVAWFEAHLPNPSVYEDENGKRGTSWFKQPIVLEMYERLELMRLLLEKYQVTVDILKEEILSGSVIHSDDYQVVLLESAE